MGTETSVVPLLDLIVVLVLLLDLVVVLVPFCPILLLEHCFDFVMLEFQDDCLIWIVPNGNDERRCWQRSGF